MQKIDGRISKVAFEAASLELSLFALAIMLFGLRMYDGLANDPVFGGGARELVLVFFVVLAGALVFILHEGRLVRKFTRERSYQELKRMLKKPLPADTPELLQHLGNALVSRNLKCYLWMINPDSRKSFHALALELALFCLVYAGWDHLAILALIAAVGLYGLIKLGQGLIDVV